LRRSLAKDPLLLLILGLCLADFFLAPSVFGEFGSTPEGSAEKCDGRFRDKSDPLESRPISINGEIYFAGQSRPWGNGGVAFIRENSEQGSTLGRKYLITEEQFNDVVMQENSKEPDGNRFVPAFNQLVSQPQSILPGDPWYGKLLNMGSEGGWPTLTFTTARTMTRTVEQPQIAGEKPTEGETHVSPCIISALL
jgi:hypothetical protein